MFAAAAAQAGHPAVAALLGLGTAGVAGVVVAMAWGVHVRQIRLAEQLTHRQLVVTGETDPPTGAAERDSGPPAAADAIAERLGADRAKRAVLALASAVALWSVSVRWGHPEDAVAVGLLLYAILALSLIHI